MNPQEPERERAPRGRAGGKPDAEAQRRAAAAAPLLLPALPALPAPPARAALPAPPQQQKPMPASLATDANDFLRGCWCG